MSEFIVGYVYQADTFCPDHIVEQVDGQAPVTGEQVEAKLDYLAMMLGVNRQDEHSFGTRDFPKVITRQQAEHDQGWDEEGKGSTCGVCGLVLTEWDT